MVDLDDMTVPPLRQEKLAKKKKKKRKNKVVTLDSDEEQFSDAETVLKEGNPLENCVEVNEEGELPKWNWQPAAKGATFDWLRTPTEGKNTRLRNKKATDFARRSPFQVFLMFVTPEFLKGVAEETTRYGKITEGDKFVSVSTEELILWHGIVLGMTLSPLPNKEKYWQTGTVGTVTYPNFGRFMARNRFVQIKRNFHLRSNEGRENYDPKSGAFKLWQNQGLIDLLRKQFKQWYSPGQTLTVDERTIPIRNRTCPIRIYNPSKPYKFGIEVFTMCDSVTYFCYDFLVYDKVPQLGLNTNVVLQLAKELPAHRKFTLILDRGFTSPILLHKLSEMGHGATGTIMRSRKHYPSRELKLPADAKVGEYVAKACESTGMVATVWKDKRPVYFLSTAAGK